MKYTTKRVFTDGEYIVAVCNACSDSRLISAATKVFDYGSFYYISFPMGQKSDKFVCQKNLLTQGTLEEFEVLFEGKITIKHK